MRRFLLFQLLLALQILHALPQVLSAILEGVIINYPDVTALGLEHLIGSRVLVHSSIETACISRLRCYVLAHLRVATVAPWRWELRLVLNIYIMQALLSQCTLVVHVAYRPIV